MRIKKSCIIKIIKEEILREVTSSEFSKLLESDPDILQTILPAVNVLIQIEKEHNISPEDIVKSVQEIEKTGLMDALLNNNK